MYNQKPRKSKIYAIISLGSLMVSLSTLPVVAQKPSSPDKFPPNPIEQNIRDPLLPRPPRRNQQLPPDQAQQLSTALDALNVEAASKYQAGEKENAYQIWNRELRLRKYLGTINEVQALARVGQIAWSDTNREQVFFITQRLQNILNATKKQKTNDRKLWQALGDGFASVRAPKPGIEVLNNLLTSVRGTEEELPTLRKIGDLHMSWFDYPNAAKVYTEIFNKTAPSADRLTLIANLKQLAYIYDQGKQPQEAIKAKNQLVDIYTQDKNLIEIPKLRLAIATDYEKLAKAIGDSNPTNKSILLEEAFNNYQIAYTTAWQNEQYAGAGEVLRKLIALYRQQGQLDDALKTSQILLEAEIRAANYYEVMNAYGQIGEMHLQRQEKPQALAAFQKGLEIAQVIKHDENYFTEQIQKLSSSQ